MKKFTFVRPSEIVHAIEEGVIHIPATVRGVAAAVRNEYRARQLADAHMTYERSSKERDMRDILDRAAAIIEARAKHEADKAQRAKDFEDRAYYDTLLNTKRSLRDRFFGGRS